LYHIDLVVPNQTLFGLLGPNGAGKTTLFSVVAGFLRPARGEIKVLDIDIRRIADLQGRLAILPQDAQFQSNMPILEQMIFFSLLSGRTRVEAEAEAKNALELVGLEEVMKRSARVLSHGMTKRLGIAQAFLGKPEVILLDEPTAGLDPANAKKMRDLIRELKGKATLVISSHDLREIQEMCSHVAILDKGRLVATGNVEEITRAARQVDLRVHRELSSAEIEKIQAIPEISKVVEKDFCEYTIQMDLTQTKKNQDNVIALVLNTVIAMGAFPRRLTEGVSLESFFLEVTGEKTSGKGPS